MKQVKETSLARMPPLFGAAFGLAIILPLLNFFRDEPIGDFFGEWSSALALSVAALAIAQRVPRQTELNWSTIAIPILVASIALIQALVGKYFYASDWLFLLAYIVVASLALILGQILGGEATRKEFSGRIAWVLVLAASVNLVLQILQAARMDIEWFPYIIYLPEGSSCRLFGNVGQNNHANTLAWLGIAGVLYLLAERRLSAPAAATLLGVLLTSSALTVSRMAWLFLGAAASLLAIRHLWPGLNGRSRILIATAMVAGLAVANWSTGAVRGNITGACESSVDRLAEIKEAGSSVRPLLWQQALQVWAEQPWLGAGSGGFIGSVFRLDLGEGHQPLDSWVHNTALQILAEFGLIAVLGIAAVFALWILNIIKHREELASEDGFVLIGLAVLAIHSMLEFPLWYIHFLALAALFVGLLIRPKWSHVRIGLPARASLLTVALLVASGSLALVIDYRKLDRLGWISRFIQSVGMQRAPDAQITLEEAAAQVRFFSQFRDYYLALGRPLTKEGIEGKVFVVERALNRMPNIDLIQVRVLLATLQGDMDYARSLLRRAFKFHPQHAELVSKNMLLQAESRPDEFAALGPIVVEEMARRPSKRW